MSEAPPPGEAAAPPDEEAACWRAARQIREERPGWVVIWIARTGQFKAYPKFAAPRGTAPTAQTPDQLTAQMEQVEQAARRPRSHARRPSR